MFGKYVLVAIAIVWLELSAASLPALGDGGTLRFSGLRGDHVVSVFTAPAPLRSGPIDLSVLVQDSRTGRPITDLPIEVHAQRIGGSKSSTHAVATTDAATNKLFRAARLELAQSGRWHVDVSVQVADRSQPVIGFDVDVAEPPPPWLQMGLWIAWPLLPIGLFAIHQLRVRSSKPGTPAGSSPRSNRI